MLPACRKACSHRRQHVDITKPRAEFEFVIPALKRQDITICSVPIFFFLETYQFIKPGNFEELFQLSFTAEQPVAKLDNRKEMA